MAGERADWELVWQGTSEVEASIVAGRLEADGFRTLVRGHHMPQRSVVFLRGSFGVAVPARSAQAARDSLRRNGEGHNIIEPVISKWICQAHTSVAESVRQSDLHTSEVIPG